MSKTALLLPDLQNEMVDPQGKLGGALAGPDAGFAVTVLENCCAAPNPAWHLFSVKNMLPLFGAATAAAKFAAG